MLSKKEFRLMKSNLWSLGFRSYKEYLDSYLWQSKKEWMFENSNKECERCSSKHSLQIHHLTYKRLGNEKRSDLIFLCKECHEEEHGL